MAKTMKPKGIYCLEIGDWYNDIEKLYSVRPILELLRCSPLEVPYVHRDIATAEELWHYVGQWRFKKHADYPILYLSVHGEPGYIDVDTGSIEIKDLFEQLKGRCAHRVIHLGACSTLRIPGQKINEYLKTTKAAAISGYTKPVDWVESSVFEMLYLAELQKVEFTKRGMETVKARLARIASGFESKLQFRMDCDAKVVEVRTKGGVYE